MRSALDERRRHERRLAARPFLGHLPAQPLDERTVRRVELARREHHGRRRVSPPDEPCRATLSRSARRDPPAAPRPSAAAPSPQRHRRREAAHSRAQYHSSRSHASNCWGSWRRRAARASSRASHSSSCRGSSIPGLRPAPPRPPPSRGAAREAGATRRPLSSRRAGMAAWRRKAARIEGRRQRLRRVPLVAGAAVAVPGRSTDTHEKWRQLLLKAAGTAVAHEAMQEGRRWPPRRGRQRRRRRRRRHSRRPRPVAIAGATASRGGRRAGGTRRDEGGSPRAVGPFIVSCGSKV